MFRYLVFVGGGIQLIGTFWYIKTILFGDTKPNRVTYLMWSIAPLIATFAALSKGVGWAVLPVFLTGFGPFLIFIISFTRRKFYWRLGALDYACGICSALALILWAATNEPVVAIALAIVSDALAGIPTLIKAWQFPKTESGLAYLATVFSCLLGFTAIKIWNFSSYGFLVYLIMINLAIFFAAYQNKLKFFKSTSTLL